MSKNQSFRLPHLTHPHFPELNDVVEDNVKLISELKCGAVQDKINNVLAKQELLTPDEVRKLHLELWEAYQQMLGWISVCTILGIEITSKKYVQAILDRLWELLKTNPCTDKIPFTQENIKAYKKEVDKGFHPRS